jgi:hypothetical protein
MHGRVRGCIISYAPHIKPAFCHYALEDKFWDLHHEWLQEENTVDPDFRRHGSARHLQVARAREDDATVHDVVGDEGLQRTSDRRTEDIHATRGRQTLLRHGML